jgi:uncharacterized protein YjiS (DUF1127 family)
MASRTRDGRLERSEPIAFMPRIFGRRLARAIDSSRTWQAASTFLRAFGRSAGAYAAELRARRAIGYLRSLDDNRLLDLGITRRDIERFVRSRSDERWKR